MSAYSSNTGQRLFKKSRQAHREAQQRHDVTVRSPAVSTLPRLSGRNLHTTGKTTQLHNTPSRNTAHITTAWLSHNRIKDIKLLLKEFLVSVVFLTSIFSFLLTCSLKSTSPNVHKGTRSQMCIRRSCENHLLLPLFAQQFMSHHV